MTTQIDRLDQCARALKDGTRPASDFGVMSTGEQIYIALAASNFELLQATGYDIPSALNRLGEDWRRQLLTRWGGS